MPLAAHACINCAAPAVCGSATPSSRAPASASDKSFWCSLIRKPGAKVRQALMGGFAASRILEVHGERMVKRTFAPGFRIGLHQKDLNLALAGARALGVALPQTAGAAQLMQACAANGMQDLDHSALVRALELMANHTVAPDVKG